MKPSSRWYWNRVNLFDGVDDGARDVFLRNSSRRTLRKGQHVFRADDDANQVFYLEHGMVRIYNLTRSGDLTIYWYCVPGELFGAGGITGALKQSVNGQAISPCVVYALPRASFEQMLRFNAQLAINALKLMGGRLRIACDTIADMRSQKTDSRVARALLRLAYNCGVPVENGVRLDAPITHQEIGNLVGACRQTVTEVLQGFEARGWLSQCDRQITIISPQSLDTFADLEEAAKMAPSPRTPAMPIGASASGLRSNDRASTRKP